MRLSGQTKKLLERDRVTILSQRDGDHLRKEMARDVAGGLSAPQKCIPSKYFYDAEGSRLFEEICLLPEYYQTRTEMAILDRFRHCIMGSFDGGDVVELGSGANWKIRRLLDTVDEEGLKRIRYVPVDVSRSALLEASEELLETYAGLTVYGIVADFTRAMDRLLNGRRKIISFFGSTIGNFSEEESRCFLANISKAMEPEDRFIIGLDMMKEKALLEAAYNDSSNVTALFNKNVLSVVNRMLRADFDCSHFDHVAFFNEEKEQVEMHLRASRDVEAEIRQLGMRIRIAEGETIHTEICRKFSRESALRMFEGAGLAVRNWYSDEREWFSLVEFVKREK
jgi:L-histidine N-alpha-methyltransferase